jgi:hypothetical protein
MLWVRCAFSICTSALHAQIETPMKESQHATQEHLKVLELTGINGGSPCQCFARSDEDLILRRKWSVWRLQREKICFFSFLFAIFALGVWGAAVINGDNPTQLKIVVGVTLTTVVVPFIRYLTGSTPPLAALLGELIRTRASHGRDGPPECS